MLVLAREFNHLSNLGLGNLEGVDAANADAVAVHVQHDLYSLFARLGEKSLENVNDELHWRVVVVEDQHLVEAGLLGFGASLGDDAGAGAAIGAATVVAVRAARRPRGR